VRPSGPRQRGDERREQRAARDTIRRTMRPVLVPLALCATLLVSPPVHAAGEIDPDRPDLSSSARPVAPGTVQIESGVLLERTSLAGSTAERRLSVEATVRVGVVDGLELRVDSRPFVRLRGAEEDTGSGEYALSAKARLWQPPEGSAWPTLGLLPFVKLPTASAPIGSERTDAGALALASFELPAGLSLDVNAGAAAVGQAHPEGYLAEAFVGASLSRKLARQLAGFAEFFFTTRSERDGRDEAVLHTGLLYVVTPDLAVDAAVLTSVIGRAPDYALRAGFSARFGR
jgi:hypothetical protein